MPLVIGKDKYMGTSGRQQSYFHPDRYRNYVGFDLLHKSQNSNLHELFPLLYILQNIIILIVHLFLVFAVDVYCHYYHPVFDFAS